MKRLNEHLLRSMKKYGIENFIFKILIKCDKEQLNRYERYYIEKYKTTDPLYGYNKTTGGDSAFKRNYRELSLEHKQKIGNANKKFKPTKEMLAKSAVTRRENLRKKHKVEIWCLETDTVYNSIEEVEEKLKISKECIFKCLRHVNNSSNGFHICYLYEKNTRKFNLEKRVYNCGGTSRWHEDTRDKISKKAKQRWANMSIEEREKIGKKLKQANLGKHLSDEHKAKISSSGKGKKLSNETKTKISLTHLNMVYTELKCIELNLSFTSLRQAERTLKELGYKVNRKGIYLVCKKQQLQCGGLTFRYIAN